MDITYYSYQVDWAYLGIHQRGVQWEWGAVDGGGIIY